MKKLYFLATVLLGVATSFGQDLVINEIDADQSGLDDMEFIELVSVMPNMALDGYVVVLFNGNGDTSYAAYDLDGFTSDAAGVFILGNDGIPGVDYPIGASNVLQNGADAVAIYMANDTDFPNGTPVTNVNLIDALVYATSDFDDFDLLIGLDQAVQYDEDANGLSDIESLQRQPDDTYIAASPTLSGNTAEIQGFTLYPNPVTNGRITIATAKNLTKQVVIFDVLGQQVLKNTLTGATLDVSSLNTGIYMIKVTENNRTTTRKLVIR